MRMNLNLQSSGREWGDRHKSIMNSLSHIVDCGVHYVEVMCRMTSARAMRVHAIGARLSDEISADQYNYGQLQVSFDDGSVGWHVAGWGPMVVRRLFRQRCHRSPGSVCIKAETNQHKNSQMCMVHTKTEASL